MDPCTLTFAERLVLRCEDGPPDAEYVLFDPGEIELRATSPGAIREIGYETSAERALGRLSALGVTLDLVAEAARAMTPELIATYARGPVVRRAADVLGPAEIFAARTYRARSYEGVWIDLERLARDLDLEGAAIGLQLLGLVAGVSELEPSTRVALRTSPYTETRRPGERTYHRVDASSALALPKRLQALASRPTAKAKERETGPSRVEILDVIRERKAVARTDVREHLAKLERATATPAPQQGPGRAPPTQGPLSDPVMWAIESQLSEGDVSGALRSLNAVEKKHGSSPPVQYLKSRASLLAGREPPEVVAERVSLLVAKTPFAELELLAAQAWAAAGNMGRALPYARVLSMDPTADAFVRTHARVIVDAAKQGVRALPVTTVPPAPAERFVGMPRQGQKISALPRPERDDEDLPPILDPSKTGPKPQLPTRIGTPTPPMHRPVGLEPRPSARLLKGRPLTTAPELALDIGEPIPTPRATQSGRPRSMMRGGSKPAIELWKTMDSVSEVVEELSPPWEVGDAPGAAEARAQFTDMARELGRLYRTEKNIVLRTDASGIEAMQATLRQAAKAGVRSTSSMVDVRCHGAVLSEILARRILATWVDVQQPELGHWTMDVRGVARIRPFGRVLRFLENADTERDLVAYYLELWNLVQGANVRP